VNIDLQQQLEKIFVVYSSVSLLNFYIIPKKREANFIPLTCISPKFQETSMLLNKLAILKHSFVKTDNIKSGNDFLFFPKLLPLKGKKFSYTLISILFDFSPLL